MYVSQSFTTDATSANPLTEIEFLMSDGNPYYCSRSTDSDDYIRKWWICNSSSDKAGSTVYGSGVFPSMVCTTGTSVKVATNIQLATNTKYVLVVLIDTDSNKTGGIHERSHWDYSESDAYTGHKSHYSAEFNESASQPGANFASITWTETANRDYNFFITQSSPTPAYNMYKISDTDSPTASIVDSTNNFEAKYLTSGNGRIAFAGSSIFPRRVFYSKIGSASFDYKKVTVASVGTLTVDLTTTVVTAGMDGWDIYNATEGTRATIEAVTDSDTFTVTGIDSVATWVGDTLYLTDSYIELDNAVTGVTALGDQDPFLTFTKTNAYVFDPITNFSKNLGEFGCSSHRSIKVLRSSAFWINKNGIYRYSSGMQEPTKVSGVLENNVLWNGIWNGISKQGFENASAFIYKNKYYVSVGDNTYITKNGQPIEDCMLVYDMEKNSFTVYSYGANGLGTSFAVYSDNTLGDMIIGGSRDNPTIYQTEVKDLYTDSDNTGAENDYTYIYRGTELTSGRIDMDKLLEEVTLKLKTKNGTVISYAKDGDEDYEYWATTTTTDDGKKYHRVRIQPFSDANLKTISLEFSGEGEFVLYNYTIQMSDTSSTNLSSE
jgi:hypothetical protein